MLAAVDLLNRYCNGRRCREAAAELIMLLAFLCLRARRLCVACGYKKRTVTTRDIFFIGLFNRYCSSLCCREAATKLVMILVPLCLRARRLCLRKALVSA